MSKTRVHTETGVIETQIDWADEVLDLWTPLENEDGEITRINTETGDVETQTDWVDKVFNLWH